MNTCPRSRIPARFVAITSSATFVVDAKAEALKAQGRPVVGFGAGEPDFPTPEPIVEAVVRAAREPTIHRYTPVTGLPEPRSATVEKTLRDFGYEVDPTQILVTNGGKQAAFQAFAFILDPSGETPLPTPYWTTYPEVIKLTGGVTVPAFVDAEQDYKVSVEQLEATRTKRTKALLHCPPSNPMGSVCTSAETRTTGEQALGHGIWVIADEIYEHLSYEDAESAHIVKLVPGLVDQSLILNRVTKTYAMTGWRVNWMTGPGDVIKVTTSFQPHLTLNISNIAQRAAFEATSGPLNAVYGMCKAFDRHRRIMIFMLSEIESMTVPTPESTFYAYPNVEDILGRRTRDMVPTSPAGLANLILDEVEVVLVPGEASGPSEFLHLPYVFSDDDLVKGVSRVQSPPVEAQ